MRYRRALWVPMAAALCAAPARGAKAPAGPAALGPRPGDVFREYRWRPKGKWQRVTGPDATAAGAKRFLPNAVNRIRIDDLAQAVRAEAHLEMLLCHGGTMGKKVRINGGAWRAIPESDRIPGPAGRGGPDCEYQSMRYPTVEIPLRQVRRGQNTFEFTCRRGSSLGGWWPQWILYGVTFRVYYAPGKPHPTGAIPSPAKGATIGERPVFQATAGGPRAIRQVDFLGCYEDFDWEGDGRYRRWHWRSLYGEIRSHIGTARRKPYQVTWDNRWVPTQAEPIRVCARIVDETNLCYMTPAVGPLRLVRPRTVRMYRPYDVPRLWSTRAGKRHQCKVDVPDDLGEALAARCFLTTWNGVAAEEIGINGRKVVAKVGRNHDLSYDSFDVPVQLIRRGTNRLYTFSKTDHHGIEVQWPGMVLMIRYARPEPSAKPKP